MGFIFGKDRMKLPPKRRDLFYWLSILLMLILVPILLEVIDYFLVVIFPNDAGYIVPIVEPLAKAIWGTKGVMWSSLGAIATTTGIILAVTLQNNQKVEDIGSDK